MKEHPLSNIIFIWEVKIAGDLGELFILMVNVDQSHSELEISDGGNTQASDSLRRNLPWKWYCIHCVRELYELCCFAGNRLIVLQKWLLWVNASSLASIWPPQLCFIVAFALFQLPREQYKNIKTKSTLFNLILKMIWIKQGLHAPTPWVFVTKHLKSGIWLRRGLMFSAVFVYLVLWLLTGSVHSTPWSNADLEPCGRHQL